MQEKTTTGRCEYRSEDITGIQPDSSSDCSDSDDTETTKLGHNNDITDRKHVAECFIHPVTSAFVYKSATGGAPYLCEDCDYKTTVNYMFLDHMNLHYIYSNSDNSERSMCRCVSVFPVYSDALQLRIL